MADGRGESDRSSSRSGVHVGALYALAGALIGALASVWIAWWGFEREEDASNRSAKESAYIEFMQASDAFVFSLRHGDIKTSGDVPTLDRVLEAQTLVSIYGSEDAIDACGAMVAGMSSGIGDPAIKEHRESDESWDEYYDARTDFHIAVQASLEID